MKLRLSLGFFVLLTWAASLLAGPRDVLWQQVETARERRLPQSALKALPPIIAGALADRAYGEAIRAIGQKLALERELAGGQPEEQVTRILAELEQAPPALKPALEAILAHWYWHYFQSNRGRFLRRTQTADSPGADFRTWDLARILQEIDARFTAALADEQQLQRTPVSAYDLALEPGTVPDVYRPTLFDFLAYEALAFYQSGEQGAFLAEDRFELDAASPIFAEATAFAGWQPESTDTTSPILKALRLYRQLLALHRDDPDRSAFYDADFARLVYGYNVAVGADKDERYHAALERFIAATAQHEVSARARAELAGRVYDAGDPARAHALAARGLRDFPATAGGAACYNLIQRIEAKSAELRTESVWNAPWPTLDVTYRNVARVYFRAVPVDFEALFRAGQRGFDWVSPEQAKEILQTPPALAWQADLPPTPDFRTRTESLPAPATLSPGFYYVFASHDPAFSDRENQIGIAPVWVSDLALVTRQHGSDPLRDGSFVLWAGSGEPVAGAAVRFGTGDRQGQFHWSEPVTTDANGRFPHAYPAETPVTVYAIFAGHSVASQHPLWGQGGREEREDAQTVFFTDRALYRPGQTIHYKGIAVRHDTSAATYETLARTRVTVSLRDANGQEVAQAEHTTNDYGSFSGMFTAPRDRALGYMWLQATGVASGQTGFRVEEYKRPKFQVELAAPAAAPRLGAATQLTGKAAAYTGAALGGAKVRWRVERAVRLPRWCWWWSLPAVQSVAHGSAVTAADGTFDVTFVAAPDRTVPARHEPIFSYRVHADVTDTTGETRSADRTFSAGYTALQAEVTADDWQTPDRPVAFTVVTRSLDGEPQPAEGTLTLHALRQPAQVARAALPLDHGYGWLRGGAAEDPPADPANPDSWESGPLVGEQTFRSGAEGRMTVNVALPAGVYRVSLATQDRFGEAVTARHTVQVLDPQATRHGIKQAARLAAPRWSLAPGERFTALWGTGYDRGRAFVEWESDGRTLQSYWTPADRTQSILDLPITAELRGGVTLRVTYVRENRAYFEERLVDVPWTDRALTVAWESFRSKLLPGQSETWTAVVTGPDAQRATAEMVATLYDASLDQFSPHTWPQGFDVFRREATGRVQTSLHNLPRDFHHAVGSWTVDTRDVDWRYRMFTEDLGGWRYFGGDEMTVLSPFEVSGPASDGYRAVSTLAGTRLSATLMGSGAGDGIRKHKSMREVGASDLSALAPSDVEAEAGGGGGPPPDLNQVTARKNLQETAFFFPHLLTDESGTVKLQFTLPEALTEWRFFGFAHDARLRSGFLTAQAVTAKDLMVEPNPPRFVREGDTVEFTVKVTNRTDRPQTGRVRLTFADAATLQSVDAALGNAAAEQAFAVPARESRSFAWRIAVPDGLGFLTYKAIGATAAVSDGEEGFLPVLSRRILVTESLPLPIRGPATKSFEFARLLASGQSDSLRSQSLTVQMVSQPAWSAVMALPYLMEYPYECSEQVFNRLYANALARRIAGSDPKLRRIFDLWKNTPALDSPLAQNQDLKAVLLEETPWLRQATNESQARRHVGLLFDAARLDEEAARALRQLSERQLSDGLWSWFPGGRPSEYISLYLATGFGRLRALGVEVDLTTALRSLDALDAWMAERHRKILAGQHPERHVPDSLEAFYLYGRSFFLADRPLAPAHRAAVDFYLGQARRFWTKLGHRQSEAHLALALHRFGDKTTPRAILQSLKERSVHSEELGRYWRDEEASWWWYRAPIETQAMMIEAFAELGDDAQVVEDCQVWLLKQKQTQDWKTTKATADAVYALLLRGGKLLASDALVEVSLAGRTIQPERVEAGTGFYEHTLVRGEIQPAMGHIVVKKTDPGVSWGSVHWQYLEDLRKVTPHTATPLQVKKTLYVKETTKQGPVLRAITGPVAVGDELVVRLELRTDRDMEYVHLKDQRGSGTEPVQVLSQYRFQDGLAYYESTRDTATHFFIDYLPKGTYVFETSTRVQLRGSYQTGIAELQCLYAPEFNSHSESLALEVR